MSTKKILMLLVMSVFLLSSAQGADASYQIITGSNWGPYQSSPGGEFTVQPSGGLEAVLLGPYYVAPPGGTKGYPNGSSSDTFQTFCLENNLVFPEAINLNQTYDAVLNTNAVRGGVGPAGDPISIGTAWLYSQFALGTLANYSYDPLNTVAGAAARQATARLLQDTIWALENEGGIAWTPLTNIFMKMIDTQYVNQVGGQADANGAFNVWALNLTSLNGAYAQDLLVVAPIPGAVWLLGSGLLGLLGLRRKFVG